MSTYSVSPVITVLISHPFCTPDGNAPLDRHARVKRLKVVASALSSFGKCQWSLFDITGILPRVMSKRKGCLLRTEEKENAELTAILKDANQSFESSRQVLSIKHSACASLDCALTNNKLTRPAHTIDYWDAGLGAVGACLILRNGH